MTLFVEKSIYGARFKNVKKKCKKNIDYSYLTMENRLGFLNIMDKTTVIPESIFKFRGEHCYQRHQKVSYAAPRNVGIFKIWKSCEHLTIGVFTASKAGIYQFSFSIAKESLSFETIWIYLCVNGNKMGISSKYDN